MGSACLTHHTSEVSAGSAASMERRSGVHTLDFCSTALQQREVTRRTRQRVRNVGSTRKLREEVHIKYIWSRTGDSAQLLKLQSDFTADAEVAAGDEGFEAILRDPDVAGVLVVLPPHVGPQFALRAVKAGKPALSEKPVATTVAEAQELVAQYRALRTPPPWLVGENFRFQTVLSEASAIVSQSLGKVHKIEVSCDVPFPKKTSYLSCGWRRDGDILPGGFMTDIGVHEIAALRMVAEAAGGGAPLRAVATTSHDPDAGLTDPDTLMGLVEWQSGLCSSVCITLASAFARSALCVSGSNGTLDITRSIWNGKGHALQHELTYHTVDPDELESRIIDIDGMDREIVAFVGAAAAGRSGGGVTGDLARELAKGAPEQGLMDLKILEALLASARSGRPVMLATEHTDVEEG